MTTLEDAILLVEDGWPQRFTPEQAGVYLEALADLDPVLVRAAVIRLVRTDEFRPSVARIRAEVLSAGAPTAEQALAQAEAVMRYRESLAFVNGSGFTPVRPDVDDRVLVVLTMTPRHYGWRERFVTLWKQQAWRTTDE